MHRVENNDRGTMHIVKRVLLANMYAHAKYPETPKVFEKVKSANN